MNDDERRGDALEKFIKDNEHRHDTASDVRLIRDTWQAAGVGVGDG